MGALAWKGAAVSSWYREICGGNIGADESLIREKRFVIKIKMKWMEVVTAVRYGIVFSYPWLSISFIIRARLLTTSGDYLFVINLTMNCLIP